MYLLECLSLINDTLQAQSGTGKTGAFAIGVLQQLDTAVSGVQALILSPTRELAQQTERVVAVLGDYQGARTHASVGGSSVADDTAVLRRNAVHVVCATPRRILEHIRRGVLHTRHIRTLVLDEVDVMLSEGFKVDYACLSCYVSGS